MPNTLTLTDSVAESIAAAVANGVPLETAAIAAGVGRSTVHLWVAAGETGQWPQNGSPVTETAKKVLVAFAASIQRARAEWEAKQIAAISEAAQTVNAKTGIREWRAGAWLLNNHPATRERYREHRQTTIEQTGQVSHVHSVVRELPEQELLALAAGEPMSHDTSHPETEMYHQGSENPAFSDLSPTTPNQPNVPTPDSVIDQGAANTKTRKQNRARKR